VRVVIYPSAVQGADAPAALESALRIAGSRAEVDTLLLVRGGGSLEDLWAFNDERVVRAVAACPIPVVCGVGHETDFTLADLAADLRAATPTAAAELVAPAQADSLAELMARQVALQRAAERRLTTQAQRLDGLAVRLGQPARGLAGQRQQLDALSQRLRQALQHTRTQMRQAPQQLATRMARPARTNCAATACCWMPPTSACRPRTRAACCSEAMPGCRRRMADPWSRCMPCGKVRPCARYGPMAARRPKC
jgi:exodeoxyribonuclease VII large subunit